MQAWLLAIALTVVGADSADTDQEEPRRLHNIQKDMTKFLRAESLAKSLDQRGEAIRGLAVIYREIQRDPRLSNSDYLKGYKAKIWSRLTRVKTKLQRDIARKGGRSPRVKPSANRPNGSLTDEDISDSLAANLALVGYSLGGPGQMLAQNTDAFGGAAADNGESLVDLIERIIAPDSWDTNGGPGSIVYYAQWHCLVVTATSEIHRDVGGVLDGVRRAGM